MPASFKDVQQPVRYCTVCPEHRRIPPDRVARHSPFCSEDCRKADKNDRRNIMAGKKCRLCKRRFPKPRGAKAEDATPKLFTTGAPGAQGAPESSQ
jgi:hypothetical protein